MPELPDVTVYVEALRERIAGHVLKDVIIRGPFLLRSLEPTVDAVFDKSVRDVTRMGKRIVISFESDSFLVVHLMIAGRLHWVVKKPKIGGRNILALFEFDCGFLTFTEAGSQRRASLHVISGAGDLKALDPGGLEVMTADLAAFAKALQRENHTLKRALTDPHIFSGIGNAYSDEILHHAQLSPILLTQKMNASEVERLFRSCTETLQEWTNKLREEAAGLFPEHVTAFRKDMAAHGKYGEPCPRCGEEIQRIRYSSNETNYCAKCQTKGRLLADRALSRLLREDWPKTLEELEMRRELKG
jgi:formamidopyrimidine-DNA glycosylase